MTEHSFLPPSSAARRVACPGSRGLEAKYPEDKESPHAREGALAHWVAAETLQGRGEMIRPAQDCINQTLGTSDTITDEMIEGAELYAACIRGVTNDPDLFKLIRIEERVDISRIHPQCWGTPDAWVQIGNDIHIWDYKFGHGHVEVFENWQLIEYAAGIIDKQGINGYNDQRIFINFYIVQPRAYHRDGPIRTWRVKASELRGYFNTLEAAEEKASHSIAECHPNPECTYCLGRHACEALQRSALAAASVTELNTPMELSPHSLGNELRYLKHAAELLEARITGLEEQSIAIIRRGERVPFFKLEQGSGRERWKMSATEIITFGDMLGINLSKPPEAITPKQAIKAGVQPDLIERFVERPPGALKLVVDEGNSARKIFGSK